LSERIKHEKYKVIQSRYREWGH